MSALPGNKSSVAARRLFTNMLRRVLAQDPERTLRLAEKLISSAEAGESWAFKELIDRVDGKAPQPVIGGEDDDPAVKHSVEVNYVDAGRSSEEA